MRKIQIAVFAVVVATVSVLGLTRPGEAGSEVNGVYLQVVDGSRVKANGRTAVFFVDDGVLRHIHYDAYVRLWSGWKGIVHVTQVPETAIGEPVRGTSRLVRVPGERAVWFLDNDRVRRWVPTFEHAQFDGAKVGKITAEELERYEIGSDLN